MKESKVNQSEVKIKKELMEKDYLYNVRLKLTKKEKHLKDNLFRMEISKGTIKINSTPKNMQNNSIYEVISDSFELNINNKTNKSMDFKKYSNRKDHFISRTASKVLTYIESPKAINKKWHYIKLDKLSPLISKKWSRK